MNPSVTPEPAPLALITLADLLSATEIVAQKEDQDRAALQSIGALPFETLRASLLQWARLGFRNAYPVYTLPMVPPDSCSDGVSRGLADYVTFLTDQTMPELIAPLQARCPDFLVSFATTGSEILIVISRA